MVGKKKDIIKRKVGRPRTKEPKEKLPVGRPLLVIDYEMVKQLAEIGCTIEEIGSFLGISHDTLTRREEFLPIYHEGLNKCKRSLRRMQIQAAREGNATMLVWLGKQLLNQSDKRETEMTIQGGDKPIKIMPVQERIKEYERLFEETT